MNLRTPRCRLEKLNSNVNLSPPERDGGARRASSRGGSGDRQLRCFQLPLSSPESMRVGRGERREYRNINWMDVGDQRGMGAGEGKHV
eukprot:scaffold12939_cov97-Isochrysis_galbana.AAC.2